MGGPSPPPSANGEHWRSIQRGRAQGQWRAPKRWWNILALMTRRRLRGMVQS